MRDDSKPAPPTTADAAAVRRPRRAALGFVFVSVLLATLASSVIGPVLPQLLKQLTGGKMSAMSTAMGAMAMLFAAMQFFAGPVQGALSDRFGRRPVILIANFGLAIDYVIMATAPNLAWLFVGRAVTGATAGSITAAYAYLADITEPDERAARFGLLTAGISAGAAAGPLVGGLLGEIGPRVPFWASAALSVVAGIYGVFVLPESLPKESRAPLKWQAVHPVAVIRNMLRDYPVLGRWFSSSFLMTFGISGVNSLFLLYVLFRFGWTPKAIGLYSAVVVVVGIVVQSGLVSHIIRLVGERGALVGGLAIQGVAIALCGLVPNGWMFTAVVALMQVGGVSAPAQMAIMNRIIGPMDRGRLSGATRSLASLTGVLAPAPFAALFAIVSRGGPASPWAGAPFYLCGAFMMAGLLALLPALRQRQEVLDA
ncbi:MAG TPA: MFS transporter [Caulobacteraceae bacterium]|jgi:DHA1 family tetracycline resistance protein-like MFS transporter